MLGRGSPNNWLQLACGPSTSRRPQYLTATKGNSTSRPARCKKAFRDPTSRNRGGTELTNTTDFQEYQALLWRVFAVLARRGYAVRPDDARDVLHDFYLDAWPGALERFDRTKGSLEGYLTGAFYRFARRKCVENIRWHQTLVSAELLESWPSDHPGPAEVHEAAERRTRFDEALGRLDPAERQAVLAYLNEDVVGERAIARTLGVTRHEVRRRLASAVQRLAAHMQQRGGSHSLEHRPAGTPGAGSPAIKEAPEGIGDKEEARMDKNQTQALLARLFAPGHSPAALPHGARERLRHALVHDDVEFAPEQVTFLHEHPEALAEFYESLFPIEELDGRDMQEQLARGIHEAAEEEGARLEEAFEVLIGGLPPGLQDCERCFYGVDRETLRWALSFTSIFRRRGDGRADLRTLLPAVTAGAMRGLVLLFDDALAQADDAELRAETRWAIEPPSPDAIVVRSNPAEVKVPRDLVRSQLEATPNLPPEAASSFARWVLDVIDVCPTFVRGYELVAREPWVFEHTAWRSSFDLVNLWDPTKHLRHRLNL